MPDIFINQKEKPTQKKAATHTKRIEAFATNAETQPLSPFSSYCENPEGVWFQTEDPNERVLLFLKKHFITNVPWIATTFFLLFLPLLITVAFRLAQSPFTLPDQFLTVFSLFYYLLVFAYAFVNFITWFYNILLVTEKRIVDIDFSDIVYHDVAETKLSLVEDVNYTQTGFIRTFFNYGDVFIQTAGGKENIEALAVPKPGKAVRIIGDLIGKGERSG